MNSFNQSNVFDTLLGYFEHVYDMLVEEGFDFSQAYLAIYKRFKDEMKKDPNAPIGFDMAQITLAIREVIDKHKNKMNDNKINEVIEIPRNTTSEEIILENSKIELRNEIERNAKLDAERYWRSELRSVVEQKLRNEIMGELERSIRIKVERELKNESYDKDKNELRDKLKDEVRQDLRNELRDEVKAGLENEMINEVKIELKKKLYDEAKNELKEEMRSKVEKELEHKLRNDESLNRGIYNRVREELHDKFMNEMKKEDIRNEVKGELLHVNIINNVLNSAIEHDYPEIVKLLINDYCVDLETEDESGMTLLMKAAKNKRYNIVRMILNKISDSSVDSDGSNESSEVLIEDSSED